MMTIKKPTAKAGFFVSGAGTTARKLRNITEQLELLQVLLQQQGQPLQLQVLLQQQELLLQQQVLLQLEQLLLFDHKRSEQVLKVQLTGRNVSFCKFLKY